VPNDRKGLLLDISSGFRIIEAEGRDIQVCFAGMGQSCPPSQRPPS